MGRRLVPALPGGGSRCGARTPSLDSPASTCASRCGAPTTIAGWSRRCAGCWSVWPRWAVGDRAAGAGPAAGALGIRRAVGGRPGVAVPVRVLGGARRRTRLGAYLARPSGRRSEEHTSELQSRRDLVCRLLLEKKKKKKMIILDSIEKKKKKIK